MLFYTRPLLTCLKFLFSMNKQWRIQDFPNGGRSQMGASVHHLANFSWKLHENKENWAGNGHRDAFVSPLPGWIIIKKNDIKISLFRNRVFNRAFPNFLLNFTCNFLLNVSLFQPYPLKKGYPTNRTAWNLNYYQWILLICTFEVSLLSKTYIVIVRSTLWYWMPK